MIRLALVLIVLVVLSPVGVAAPESSWGHAPGRPVGTEVLPWGAVGLSGPC